MQDIEVDILKEPFPHLILYNFYNDKELKLIWEELNFYTKKDKLFEAKDYGGIPERTNSKAIWLDKVYSNKCKLCFQIIFFAYN